MRAAKLHLVVGLATATWLAAAGVAHADGPCGGLDVGDGAFIFRERLSLDLVEQQAGTDCLQAVAAELGKRPDLQAVTVSARVPNDKAMRDKGLAAVKYAAEKLVGLGVSRGLVSTVVPAGRPDEKDGLYISFVQRRSARPVALVQTASGKVMAGPQLATLHDATPGSVLLPTDYLQTGRGSVATFVLLDGSRAQVSENTTLRLTQIDVNAQGARTVKVQLLRGELRVRASETEGAFDVTTMNATAGVRGMATEFRIEAPTAQDSRVEALDETVVFKGKAADLFVAGGQASAVDFKGRPEEAHPLLVAPVCEGPLFGLARAGDFIRWRPVPNAQSYRLEIADNAQFTAGWWAIEVNTEKWLVSDQLKPGKHFWRVTPIDPEGFLGYASKVYAFTVP